MRIVEIHADGFGLLHNRAVEPGEHLTVVRGENETGKTTLLTFVRSMLFGFENRSYRALAGGRRGGWLNVEMGDGRELRIERYGETGGQGRLRVLASDGTDLGAGELPRLLQGVGAGLFRNIFAFGLVELAEFDRLNDSEVAARIYGAGLGLGAVSALDVERDLGAEADNLFKPGGQNPQLNVLLRELETVDERIRHLDLPAEYEASRAELRQRTEGLDEIEGRIRTASDERRRLERIKRGWPSWLELTAAEEDLQALGPVNPLSPDAAERLAAIETRRNSSAEEAGQSTHRRETAQARLDAISVDEGVLAAKADIERVLGEHERDQAQADELRGVREQLSGAQRQFEELRQRLGPTWDAEQIQAFDDSVRVQSEITGKFRKLLDDTAAASARSEDSLQQVNSALVTANEEIAALEKALEEPEPEPGLSLDEQESRVRDLEALLAQKVAIEGELHTHDEELTRLQRECRHSDEDIAARSRHAASLRRADDEARSATELLATIPETPGSRGFRQGAPVGIGGALIVAALADLVTGGSAIVVVILAAMGLAGAFLVWRYAPIGDQTGSFRTTVSSRLKRARQAAVAEASALGMVGDITVEAIAQAIADTEEESHRLAERSDTERQVERLRERIRQIGSQIETLAGSVSDEGLDEVVSQSRRTLTGMRDDRARRVGLKEQLGVQQRRVEVMERRKAEATAACTAAASVRTAAEVEWRSWLSGHGLDADLDRESAKTVIDAITAAKRPLSEASSLRNRETELRERHDTFRTSLLELTSALEIPCDPESEPGAIVSRLREVLDSAEGADAQRKAAAENLEKSQLEEVEAQQRLERCQEEITALLSECHAGDAEALRGLIQREAAARNLEDRIKQHNHALVALSGPGGAFDSLCAELADLADIDSIDGRMEALAAEIVEAEESRGPELERVGALRASLGQMETNVAATWDRQLRADLHARLERGAQDWAVIALAQNVLSRAREAYEAAHRPSVVEKAERYFEDWTDGRYRRILAPLGRQIEEVEHRDGSRVPVQNLSTGTAQQLYLALRFGLVDHFSETAEGLPILMDDILVNFDDRRAARAARAIESLAERHQIIYFTCHPETPLRDGKEIALPALETVAQAVAQ
jgi:uncharacterized protein YhaN